MTRYEEVACTLRERIEHGIYRVGIACLLFERYVRSLMSVSRLLRKLTGS